MQEFETKRVGGWCQTAYGRQVWPLDPRPEEVHIDDIAHSLGHICRFNGACRPWYSVAEHCTRAGLVVERLLIDSVSPLSRWMRLAFWLAWHGLPYGTALWTFFAESHWPAGARDIILAVHMHDSAEAYLTDVVRPIKPHLVGFNAIEVLNERAIAKRFALVYPWPKIVHDVDTLLLATEARDLMGGECAGKWRLQKKPLPWRIRPWSAYKAQQRFLRRFQVLSCV